MLAAQLGRGARTPPLCRSPHALLPPSPQGSRAAEEPAPPCPVYRLVLAGDSGTGKSSFLMRLCMNEFRDVSATLGTRAEVEGQGHREPGLTAPPGRGGLPDKAAAGGWGANYTADLGHSWAGEVSRASRSHACLWHPAGRAGRSPELARGGQGSCPPCSDSPGCRYRSIAQSYFRKAHGVLLLYDISSQSSFISIRQWIEDIKVEGRIRQPPWGRAAALGKAVLSPTWCCGSSSKPAPAGPFVEQSLGPARPWGAPGTKRAEPHRGCSSQAACPSHELPLAPAGC